MSRFSTHSAGPHESNVSMTYLSTCSQVPTQPYHELLLSLLCGLPVFRQKRAIDLMTMGTADEEQLSSSVRCFIETMEEMQVQEDRANMPHAFCPFADFTEPIPPSYMEIGATLLVSVIESHVRETASRWLSEQEAQGRYLRPRMSVASQGMNGAAGRGRVSQAGSLAGAADELAEKFLPTFVVSVGARGAGALAQALALRLNVPYTLTNWYPDGSIGDIRVDRCCGVGGAGWIYMNGVPANSRVAIVLDVLYSGVSAVRIAKGVLEQVPGGSVCGVYALANTAEGKGRELLECLHVDLVTLFDISTSGETTRLSETVGDRDFPATCSPARQMPSSTMQLIKQFTPSEIAARQARVAAAFHNIPVIFNEATQYPYCFFALTDFRPPLEPALVEDMADLCVYYANFSRCDVLVSEGDRGGGPLLQAISVRTAQPYVIASWTLDQGGVASEVTSVGFSGSHSQLSLAGLKPGMRCAFVDDMLSSGGTADAVLHCIERLGAVTVEGVFISEKLYPQKGRALPVRKGKARLEKLFPQTRLTCVVQFVVGAEVTEVLSQRIGD